MSSPSDVTTGVSALVGRHLREIRGRRSRSQEHVAALMSELGFGWERSTVSLIERGERRITVDELAGLVVLLEVRFDDLLPSL